VRRALAAHQAFPSGLAVRRAFPLGLAARRAVLPRPVARHTVPLGLVARRAGLRVAPPANRARPMQGLETTAAVGVQFRQVTAARAQLGSGCCSSGQWFVACKETCNAAVEARSDVFRLPKSERFRCQAASLRVRLFVGLSDTFGESPALRRRPGSSIGQAFPNTARRSGSDRRLRFPKRAQSAQPRVRLHWDCEQPW